MLWHLYCSMLTQFEEFRSGIIFCVLIPSGIYVCLHRLVRIVLIYTKNSPFCRVPKWAVVSNHQFPTKIGFNDTMVASMRLLLFIHLQLCIESVCVYIVRISLYHFITIIANGKSQRQSRTREKREQKWTLFSFDVGKAIKGKSEPFEAITRQFSLLFLQILCNST